MPTYDYLLCHRWAFISCIIIIIFMWKLSHDLTTKIRFSFELMECYSVTFPWLKRSPLGKAL